MTSRRVAIITGASRGLGRSMALHMAKEGLDLIITYRERRDAAESTVADIEAAGARAVALQLDTGQSRQFQDFSRHVQRVLAETWKRDRFDVLVNNAGGANYQAIAQTTEEAFDTVFRVHLKGVYFLTQKLLPLMADGGRIVNISSALARVTIPGSSAYAMMKGGVEVFTRYLARELGGRGITANTVAPGAVLTEFGDGHLRKSAELQRMVSSATALGRLAEPEDIGPMVAALVSDANRWVNGQRIEVSGGLAL
jgi:NAD(P)-dependent dehydrogenase (short-subunit alcohol dehydrogenase family)